MLERLQGICHALLHLDKGEITRVVLTGVVTGNDAPPTESPESSCDEAVPRFRRVVAMKRYYVLWK